MSSNENDAFNERFDKLQESTKMFEHQSEMVKLIKHLSKET